MDSVQSVAGLFESTPSPTTLTDVVLDTSTTLMSAEPDEIDTKLCWTLANVGEALGADRAYVLQFDAEREVLERTHEWTTNGVDSGIEVLPAGLRDEYDWFITQLERFQNVFVDDVDDLPSDASAVQGVLTVHDVRSFAAIPIVVDWTLLGAVGFDAVRTEPGWRSNEIHILRTVGDMIAHTLRRRRRERELERKNEQLEEFASVVSHDLRNPLNVASGFLSITQETGEMSYLTRVENAVERMEAIVENVLTLARRGELVGEITDVDLRETVADAWHIVDTVDTNLDIADELGSVTADRNRLSAVFENLFSNAVEHGSTGSQASPDDAVEHGSTDCQTASDETEDDETENGEVEDDNPQNDDNSITVRVGRLPDEMGFYVEDDGPGIPVSTANPCSNTATRAMPTEPDSDWPSSSESSRLTAGRFVSPSRPRVVLDSRCLHRSESGSRPPTDRSTLREWTILPILVDHRAYSNASNASEPNPVPSRLGYGSRSSHVRRCRYRNIGSNPTTAKGPTSFPTPLNGSLYSTSS